MKYCNFNLSMVSQMKFLHHRSDLHILRDYSSQQKVVNSDQGRFESNVKAGSDNNIPTDTIDAVIAHYILQSKSGLGLVLIPETFSKPRETAVIWLVFFDLKSRHVLNKTKINGECSHMGYTAHWSTGVVEGFKSFANN